jgi:uncharacterized protein
MALEGRGRCYSHARGVSERVLARVFRGGWAPRLVRAAGVQRAVRVVRHRVRCPGWPVGAGELRIGFVSDLHAGPTTHSSQIDEALTHLARERPDVLLLGGDYVFLSEPPLAVIERAVGRVRAPLGAYGVMGNHDLWGDDRAITATLERAGARVLVNESVSLGAPFEHVSIAGLDDPWTGERDAGRAFVGAPRVRVLLMHAPEGLALVGDRPFDVAVCGHTHGGHVALPGGVPVIVPGPLSRRYAHGRHAIAGGRTLLVSRGVGNTESPVRVNADPDVMLVTLCA